MPQTPWADKATIDTLTMNVMRTIASQHGGLLEQDWLTRAIDVWVPAGKQVICAQEIEEKLDAMNAQVYAMVAALAQGKGLASMGPN